MVEKKILEDLAVIKQIMLESRQRFYNVGIHLIVWGGVIILALLLTLYNISIKYLFPEYWIWLVGFGFAWIFEFWQYKRYQHGKRVYNKLNRIGSTLWIPAGYQSLIILNKALNSKSRGGGFDKF